VPAPEGLPLLRVAPLHAALLHVSDCPGAEVAAVRLRLALDATGHRDTPIRFVLVRTDAQAAELDFHGSPTVLLNGRDPFLTDQNVVGLACRLYRGDGGTGRSPTVEQLVAAIQDIG
jgi:hypothetical protein